MRIFHGVSRAGWVCCCLQIALFGLAAGAETATQPANIRSRVPSAAAQAAAQAALRDAYGDELKKTSPSDRRALVAKLLGEARQGADAERYVLLVNARDVAISLGAAPLALEAVEALGENFEVKTSTLAAEAVVKSAPNAATADARDAVLEAASSALQSGIAIDDYSSVNSLASLASLRGASENAIRAFRARLSEARTLAAEHQKAIAAEQKLRDQPDDTAALAEVGEYLCTHKGDWQRGLPLLARGGNTPMANAAAAELAAHSTPADSKKVADQWWTLAENQKNPARHHLHVHAARLYEQAMPGLSGLAKAAAEKRIGEVAGEAGSEVAASGRVVNLFKLIDLKKSVIHGDWRFDGGVLQCTSGGFVPRVAIPYSPPEEYDVAMTFSQPAFRNGVFIVLSVHGRQFFWFVKQAPPLCGFDVATSGKGSVHPPTASDPSGGNPQTSALPPFEPKRKYSTQVQVRRNSLKGYVDGKLIVAFTPDYNTLGSDGWHDIKDKTILGIGCDDPAVFYDLQVTEVSGAGKLLK